MNKFFTINNERRRQPIDSVKNKKDRTHQGRISLNRLHNYCWIKFHFKKRIKKHWICAILSTFCGCVFVHFFSRSQLQASEVHQQQKEQFNLHIDLFPCAFSPVNRKFIYSFSNKFHFSSSLLFWIVFFFGSFICLFSQLNLILLQIKSSNRIRKKKEKVLQTFKAFVKIIKINLRC